MLSLGRHCGERVAIDVGGVRVWVTVLAVLSRTKIRLGFEAPPEAKISREEILPPDPQPDAPRGGPPAPKPGVTQ